MNMISAVLPCLTYQSGTRPSNNIFCSIIERVVDAVKMVFVILAKIVVAASNLVNKGVKAIVNTATDTLWCVLAALGCVSISTSGHDYSGVSINRANLNKAPEPVDLDALALNGANINVAEISDEYDGVAAEYRQAGNRRFDTSVPDKRALTALVELANRSGSTDYERTYHSTLKKAVQNIILELRRPNNETPVEKKMRALDAIIEAQLKCVPRRLEECLRQYKLLKTATPEMEQLLLEYVQGTKEECFIEAFQGSQFHVLNYVRSRVGQEYGLVTGVLVTQDPYLRVGGTPSDESIRYEFNNRFTPEAVVEGVMARIHLEGSNTPCLDYIRAELEQQARARGEDPQNEVVFDRIVTEATQMFNGSQINQKGVIFLLRGIGILNPA